MDKIIMIILAIVVLGVIVAGGTGALETAWDTGYAQIFEWLPDGN